MASNKSILKKLLDLHRKTDSTEKIELSVLELNESSTDVSSSPLNSADTELKHNYGYQVLVDCSEKVIASLSSEPGSVGDALHGRGFISTELLREITELPVTKTSNARKLYLSILETVQHFPLRYCDFISILRSNSRLYGDLLKILEETYLKKEKDGQSQSGATSKERSLVIFSPYSTGNSPAAQVHEFESRFYELRTTALREILDKKVPVADFRQNLMTLPNTISKEHEEFIIGKYSLFMKAESVESIFLHLNFYLSFIDFSLLEHIIQHYGSPDLKKKMWQYSRDMGAFRTETPVADIIPYLSGRPEPPPSFAKLKMKLNFDVKTSTLEVLEQHRRVFGSEFSLSKFVLLLAGLQRGSLIEVWLIPSEIVSTLRDNIQQKSPAFFLNIGILELHIDEECLYSHVLGSASGSACTPSETDLDKTSVERHEEDAPVMTPSRTRIWDEITSEMHSHPSSHGMAFIMTCTSSSQRRAGSLEINSLLESNQTLASTFKKLNFATFEKNIATLEELNDVICIASSNLVSYPTSPDYMMVVVVAGLAGSDVNTLPTNEGEININTDLIEPFLPSSAPALVDVSIIFLINTVTCGECPLDVSRLSVTPKGHFLIAYTNTVNKQITDVVGNLSDKLSSSQSSVENVLSEIKGQLTPTTAMTIISALERPAFLHQDSVSKLKHFFDEKHTDKEILYNTVVKGNGFKSTVVLPDNVRIEGDVSKSMLAAKQSAAYSALSHFKIHGH